MSNNIKLLQDTINLLKDKNLVWSEDFDRIRNELAYWLTCELTYLELTGHTKNISAIQVAERMMENA